MDKHRLTLGSLFDGSGGFPLAGLLAGIEPIWASEIEPFPIRVTTKRLPRMRHFGDVSTLNGARLPPVDIITFGSPCQDMSIAGKRAGLDGERSGLFHEAIRIVKEMREATHGEKPRYIVWENVPGAFTSNNGQDFRAVLKSVINIKVPEADVPPPENGGWPRADMYVGDGWSMAYRVLDAQYWGVPQRRRRIFLVADFDGECAGDILFERESLPGDSGKSEEARPSSAEGSADSPGNAGVWCLNPQGGSDVYATRDVAGTLVAQDHGHHPAVLQAAGFLPESSLQGWSIGFEEEVSPTLRAGSTPAIIALEHNPTDSRIKISEDGNVQTLLGRMGTGGNNVPLVMEPVTLKIRSGCDGGGKGALWQVDKSATLATNNDQVLFEPVSQQPFSIGAFNSLAWLSDNPRAGIYAADKVRTLDQYGSNPSANQGGTAIVETYAMTVGYYTQVEKEKTPTLMARDFKDPIIVNEPHYRVRRLTPGECARLQGFPDGWCSGLETEEPTEEEIFFWQCVFETHRRIVSHAKKPKTRKQIVRWLQHPYTDSAEFRLWGNGVALPCVYFVMKGISENN